MNDDLQREREEVLDAIERRCRDEDLRVIPERHDLDMASPSALRALASSIRAGAWSDRSFSAEELADISDDPGWAPSARVRVAALLDHLSELASPNGGELTLPPLPDAGSSTAPGPGSTRWVRISLQDLIEKLKPLEAAGDIYAFNEEGQPLLRANSWFGHIIELIELSKHSVEKDKKREPREKERATLWADALVRSGYLRGHFGPELTAEFFRKYVVGRERVDVAVDANSVINGLVHHVARLAPHVDFCRSAITNLEIQRLYDTKKEAWRKACRCLESLPVRGPAWRSLGDTDTTSLLVARAEQGGKKAPGADALLGRDFEESIARSHGIQSALLCSDVALSRTLAARLRPGHIWAAYVDPPAAEERFLSPMMSWPKGSATEARYSCLAFLLDEMLLGGVADQILLTDGALTLELRGHIAKEHQYAYDWREPSLYMRGSGQSQARISRSSRWPLQNLTLAPEPTPSGSRVTAEQAATGLEWVRSSNGGQLNRDQIPLAPDARKEVWNFLKSIGVVDSDGNAIAHSTLVNASLHRDMEAIRNLLLRFDPIVKLMRAVTEGAHTVTAAEDDSDLGKRTFGAALNLAVSCGVAWRLSDKIGSGIGFMPQEEFLNWLLRTARDPVRMAMLVENAASELALSPARFQEALTVVLGDPRLDGKRGGSAEASPLDCKMLTIDESGKFVVTELQADDVCQLRTLQAR